MKVQVLGTGVTKFGERWGESLLSLAQEAGEAALKDAGMRPEEIELLLVGNMLASRAAAQAHLGAAVASRLGLGCAAHHVEAACASGGVAVRQAALLVESGAASKVLVVGVEKMTDLTVAEITAALMEAGDAETEGVAGATFPSLYAMIARAYMHKYGASEEDLAHVAVKNHEHASRNPLAQFQFPVTVEQVLASTTVAEPLKLLDCSPITDGAAAVVLSTAEIRNPHSKSRVQSEIRNPVFIVGSGQGQDTLALAQRKDLTTLKATREAAQTAYKQAEIEPEDIDLAEVHDCFSIAEILALEDLGFAKKGEGAKIVSSGELKLGGRCPVNTSGGLKACGHPVGATGVKQIVEVARQLWGEEGNRQVANAQIGLAQNVGGSGATAVVHILKNE